MIYRLKFDSQLSFSNPSDYPILKSWKNPSPIEDWKTLRLTRQSNSAQASVMGLHSMMIWQMGLFVELSPLIDRACQALAVDIDETQQVAIHITTSMDCLDQNHSQFKRFKNRNIGVDKYVLRADCVGDAHLFTIPDDGYTAIFVSASFKAQYEQHKGTGLSFMPIESL